MGTNVPIKVYNTDDTGTLLSPQPSLQHYPAATNDQIYSNDQTNAEWTATNVTPLKDAVGITGEPNTACTLTATAANGTVIANAIVAASGNHATAWHIKRKTGTGTIELTIDNGITWQDITSQVSTSFSRIAVDQAAVTNPQIGIRIVADTDAVIVGNAECHLTTTAVDARALPPIFITTAPVSINESEYGHDLANHSDAGSAIFFEWVPAFAAAEKTGDIPILSLNTAAGLLYYDATNNLLKSTDGTNTASVALVVAAGTTYKVGLVATEGTMAVNVDDSWGSDAAYDGSFEATAALEPLQTGRNLMIYHGKILAGLIAKINSLMV